MVVVVVDRALQQQRCKCARVAVHDNTVSNAMGCLARHGAYPWSSVSMMRMFGGGAALHTAAMARSEAAHIVRISATRSCVRTCAIVGVG